MSDLSSIASDVGSDNLREAATARRQAAREAAGAGAGAGAGAPFDGFIVDPGVKSRRPPPELSS
jgi:hypothetical protein